MEFIEGMVAHSRRLIPRWLPQRINQMQRIMKLTAIFFILFCMHAAAKGVSQTVSISGENLRLERVFTEIEQQTGYLVVCNYNILQQAQTVDLQVSNMPLEGLLKLVLKDQMLDFKINKSNIVISKNKQLAPDIVTIISIQGIIVDADGIPLAGASVRVKGKNTTVVTDENGAFSLNAAIGNTLSVSYIGYVSREYKITDDTPIRLVLVKKDESLEEIAIVSTGYQTLPKERSAGSFAQADVNVMRDRNSTNNILEQLDGLVPGLTINNAPGADKLQIRGLNSINANRSPLIVVDGLPLSDVSAINANDIETVNVLKDATAASIWGARAANGVIVITTKRGKQSNKMNVDYNGFVTFQGRPDYKYHNYMNSGQFVKTAVELFDPVINPWSNMSTSYYIMPHETILYNLERQLISEAQAKAGLDSLAGIDNRNQLNEFWIRKGLLTNHNVSVNGGGAIHSYYGSVNYATSVSNRPGEKDDQFKANLRQDFNLGSRVKLHVITDLSQTDKASKRPFGAGSDYLPYQLFQDANGNPIDLNYMKFPTDEIRTLRENQTKINLEYYPLTEMNLGVTNGRNLLARTIAGLNIEIAKGLQFEGLYGYVYGHSRQTDEEFEESYTMRYKAASLTAPPANPGGDVVRYIPNIGGIYTVRNAHSRQWTVRNQLAYNLNIDAHQINVVAGQEAQHQSDFFERSRVFGYNSQMMTYANIDYPRLMQSGGISGGYFGYMSLSSEDAYYEMGDNLSRFTSYYANASYAFNHKYVLNGSWRIDESNLFGKQKAAQNRPVWSIGAKWILGDENFMQDNNLVSKLALRATYGISGNSPNPGSAASEDIIASYTDGLISGGSAYYIDVPGNPGLSWEHTSTINVGIDFNIKGNKLSGSLDLYNKNTTGLIGVYPLNMLSGYESTTGNLGDINNKGIELSLHSKNIQTKHFNWNTQFILSYNENKLKSLEAVGRNVASSFSVGYPAYSIFAYNFVGLNGLGDPMIQLANKTITSDRVTTQFEDWLHMGTSQPVWNGSLRNTFSYKNIVLHINMIYNLGHVMRRDHKIPFTSGRLVNNIPAEFENRWKGGNDSVTTSIPAYLSNRNIHDSRRNIDYYNSGTINVLSASFVKIRDIGISYNIPSSITQKLRANHISLRAQMHNILLWTNNEFAIDPEFRGNTPTNQHAVSIGLRANF